MMLKRTFLSVFLIVSIFIIGGIGGVFLDSWLLPRLASVPVFSGIEFMKHMNDRVTIINKTEQIIMNEEDPLEKVISQPATAVVTMVMTDVSTKESITTAGVFLTNDGLMATYGDGFGDAKKYHYQAILFDGSVNRADFFGYDRMTNIGFFRLQEGTNTPAIAFANSDDTLVGKKVIALGNASAEYQSRISTGIISDIDRTFNISGKAVSFSDKWEGVFRSDAIGLAGFVGGPLVDYNGEMQGLIGMTVIDNVTQAFIVPSNALRDAMDRVIAGISGALPDFGAYYLPITKAVAIERGLSRDRGALVYSPSGKTGLAVIADSSAAKAGLQSGDIIAAINGNEITLDNPLPKLLAAFKKGDQLQISVVRGGEEKVLSVQL